MQTQVIAVNIENSHHYGNVLPAMFRLRNQEFIERLNYNVPTFKGMEYDIYDNPSTTYLVIKDQLGNVIATSRKAPTDRAYMIKDLWPNLVTKMSLPDSIKVWESSRLCVDKRLNKQDRKQVIGELVCAGLEFGLNQQIDSYIGIMHPVIFNSVFAKSGWPIKYIGEATRLPDRSKVIAGLCIITPEYLNSVQKTMGLTAPVLENLHTLNQ